MNARSFILAFAAGALTLLTAVAGLNISVDVRGVYRSNQRFVEDYVSRLQGAPRGLVESPLDRAIKLELARVAEARCYVAGSSRAMGFGRPQLVALGFDCPSVANLAVNGAGFEDLIAVIGRLDGKLDGTIILIGIDPWTLRSDADLRYKDRPDAYLEARTRLGLDAVPVASSMADKLTNLINGQYWLRNLEHLKAGRSEAAIIEPRDDEEANVLNADGSQIPGRSIRMGRLPWAKVGNGSAKISLPYVEPKVAAEFERMVEWLQTKGGRVVLVLAPYHPKVMECSSAKACEAITIVETWIHSLAMRNGLAVIGGYDPRPFGLGPEWFRDDLHMDAAAIPRLLQNLP